MSDGMDRAGRFRDNKRRLKDAALAARKAAEGKNLEALVAANGQTGRRL